MGNWFTKRLGNGAAPAPMAPPQAYPQTVSNPVPGTWPGAQSTGSYVPAPAYAPPGAYTSFTSDGRQSPDDGFVRVINEAAVQTGGSPEAREGTGVCPNCRKPSLFQQDRAENGMKLRMPAQPHCYECGWPNLQAGSRNGPASLLKARGEAKAARQLPRDHTVVVMDGSIPVAYAPQPGSE